MQNDINNPYLQKSAALFKIDPDKLLLLRWASLMPFLARPFSILLYGLMNMRPTLMKLLPFLNNYIEEMPNVWLVNNIQSVFDLRTKSASNLRKRVDLLQLMMDASTCEKIIVRIFINIYRILLQ